MSKMNNTKTKKQQKTNNCNPCKGCKGSLRCMNPKSPCYLYYCGEMPGTGCI